MSRICVKNLPKYLSDDRFREFFSQKGEITDAKLMRTKDGKSRQFGFIGYRTEVEAEEAIKFFDKSFLDTYRITCEVAHKVGDPNIPLSWSRYSVKNEGKETEKEKKLGGTRGEGNNLKKDIKENDPKLEEFLQLTQPRVKSKLWANDTVAPTFYHNGQTSDKQLQPKKKIKEILVSDDMELNKTNNVVHESSKSHPKDESQKLVYDDDITDMDYFKSRVKKEWSDSESNDGDSDDDNVEDGDESQKEDNDKRQVIEKEDQNIQLEAGGKIITENEAEKEDSDRDVRNTKELSSSLIHEKELIDTDRLFVRNLPYTATEEELEEHFSKFGNISQVHVVLNKDTKQSKGTAYIRFSLPESAARALEELDSSIFQGRLLHIMPAYQKRSSGKQENDNGQASKSFKERRVEERKASEASGDTRAWNSLFMRSDTVVEYIARKHGVSKTDFLDRNADDLAVRIALGETQAVADTKKSLENAGVDIATLEQFAIGKSDDAKRSKHVLLVKNLPYSSSKDELLHMFGKYGSLEKIILPATKILALVVFLESSEARAAFKGLAYKRFKDAPLYLEWAPANILNGSSTSDSNHKESGVIVEQDAKRMMLEHKIQGISDVEVDPDRVESRSLFVKNLNFKTTDESLKMHFSELMKEGRILSVKIKMSKKGKNLSEGYGFIQFDSVETAANVCSNLQGTILDGHALSLQICHAKQEQVQKKVEKGMSLTKLLVRNLAFEATEKDLRQLFNPFGQVKSLRLPKKFGNHRGFAFVEYVTKQEAQNALQALSHTHLYGRHLVLERAKEGESLDELRARTAAQFSDPTNTSKKRKHAIISDEA